MQHPSAGDIVDPEGTGDRVRPVWYAGPDTVLGEFWTMLHLPYTLMVLSFVVLGAVLAPKISWLLLGGSVLAYFLGLGVGAHLLDQVPGMGSRYVRHWSSEALWAGGFLSLASAVAIGVVGAVWFVGIPLLLLVAVQALCAVGYPLARWFGGLLHRDSVFALSWGSLPFLSSYYAQTRSVDLVSLLVASLLAGVAVLEIRLSRASRRLRAEARSARERSASAPKPTGRSYRTYDRALRLLSSATILVAGGLFAGRVLVSIW